MSNENNKVDINKHEIDIDNLFKQNVNDLLSIKELYSKLEELGEKITQIKYIDNTLVKKLKKEYEKLKKDYENLKKVILDENIQAKLSNDIESINSQLNTIANNIYKVFPSSFSGTDSEKIQKAIDKAFSQGGGDVVLDRDYNIDKPIELYKNVNITSFSKYKINRLFNNSISGRAIRLHGNNKISNIVYDGGSTSITVSGIDYIYYTDFDTDVDGNNVEISNCEFYNSCGSFIASSSNNLNVHDCIFYEYLDHCIYVGGRSYLNYILCDNINIQSNKFYANKSNRQALKIRNGIENFYCINNIAKLNGEFITIDIAQGTGTNEPLKDNKNIIIDGNTVECNKFLSSFVSDNTDKMNKYIKINNNKITTNENTMCLGDFPPSGKVNATSIEKIEVTNNILNCKSKQVFRLNGNLTSNNIKNCLIKANNINYNYTSFILIMGNSENVNIENNIINSNIEAFSYNNTLIEQVPSSYISLKPNIVGNINVVNNSINGYYWQFLVENLKDKNEEYVETVNNYNISRNMLNINGDFILLNVTNDTNNFITSKATVLDNSININDGSLSYPLFPTTKLKTNLITNVKDSTATDINTLKNDFNNLLDKLKNGNIII